MFLTSDSFCDVSFCEQWVLVKNKFLQYQLRVGKPFILVLFSVNRPLQTNVIKDYHSRFIGATDGGPISMSDEPPSDTSKSVNSAPRLHKLRVTLNRGPRNSSPSPKPSQRRGSNTPIHDFASAAVSAFSDHIFRISHESPSAPESPVKQMPSNSRPLLGNSRTSIIGRS